ncbi:MAG TPA: hypothetical protein VNY08_14160 [Bradyrhizobium sp.]|nr:hypothetical protein [Bradyrhizobium sp.]
MTKADLTKAGLEDAFKSGVGRLFAVFHDKLVCDDKALMADTAATAAACRGYKALLDAHARLTTAFASVKTSA